jgi:predicted NAD/FAD-binding protein
MSTKKIAIVGAGISGLGAAWMLKKSDIDCVVYEKADHIGGNAETIDVTHDGQRIPIDVGVQYIVPMLYPNVAALAKQLNVPLVPFPVSFTVGWEDNVFGTVQNKTEAWRTLEPEMSRFTFEMFELLGLKAVEVSSMEIGEYLRANQYSPLFKDKVIRGLSGLHGLEYDHDYSSSMLLYVYAICSNLLSFYSPASTFTFPGGIRTIIDAIRQDADLTIRLNCGVKAIRRTEQGVLIEDDQGEQQQYDQVIITTDGELALKMLAEPTRYEQRILSSYQTVKYPAVVHTDTSLMIPNIRDSERTYHEIRDDITTINYSVAHPSFRTLKTPLLNTYSHTDHIDPQKVLFRQLYRNDKGSAYSFEVKKHIHRIQGFNRTWYAGEGTTFSSFETALLSGFTIADKIGAQYPFRGTSRAEHLFGLMKNLMLRGEDSFKIAF